jgi:hypothetical protein
MVRVPVTPTRGRPGSAHAALGGGEGDVEGGAGARCYGRRREEGGLA